MKIKIKVYNTMKYLPESEKVAEVEYNIKSMEICVIENEDIFAMGFDEVDEYKEYCILTLEDNETCTFRNSHIDIFRI